MIFSEEQALQRWCPFARSHDESGPYNRDHPSGDIPSCIASACAVWRWAEPNPLKDIDLVTLDVVVSSPRRGYCGLAGKPELGD